MTSCYPINQRAFRLQCCGIILETNRAQQINACKLVCLLLVGMVTVLAATGSVLAGVDSVRFVVTGDTRGLDNGVNTTVLGEIVQATITENADFILIPGDLVNGYTTPSIFESQLDTWIATMQPLYDTGIGVYPCRGNHDKDSEDAWNTVFSDIYALPSNGPVTEENLTFSFTHKNVLVLGLDQYVFQSQINQTWLDEQLAANRLPHVFSFAHEPAFKINHLDCMDDYPGQRNDFWSSLTAAGSRIYLTGHDHFYDHVRIDDGDGDTNNDLHQIVVGTGGAALQSGWEYNGENGPWTPVYVHHEEEFGYLLVEIVDLDVTTTWKHRVAPGVYEPGGDVFTYSVPPQAPMIVSDPVTEARVDQAYVYDVDATGIHAPTFELTTSPMWMTIDTITGRITGSPVIGQEGLFTVEVVATNSEGADIQNFSVNVNDALQVGIENINLASASTNNLTDDTLICSYDLAEDAITAATAWYRNGSPQMGIYLPMEGGTTNMATDYSGNSLTVDVIDTPTWESTGGHDGFGAVSLDGNDHLIVSDAEALDVNYVTMSAWIYVRRYRHDQRLISKEFGVVQPYSIYTMLLSGAGNDRLELRLGLEGQDRVGVSSVSSIPLSQWAHVVATFDGSQVVLYVNGLVDHTQSASGILRQNDEPVFIGASQFSPDRNFDGLVDDVRIYDYALSSDQVRALFDGGSDIVVPQETVVGDAWQAWVTPFVSGLAGESHPSNGLTIYESPATPVIVSTPDTVTMVGQPYAYDVNADGSPAPIYSLITAPDGMIIDSITGWINWTAVAGGDFQVAVQAVSSAGGDNQSFSVHVAEPPVITSTPVVTAIVGQSYLYDVDATGNLVPTYTLISFPPEMTIGPVTGVIEWTPVSFGEFGVTVEAGSSAGADSQSFIIDVDESPTITSTPPVTGTVGGLYTYDVEATGDPTPTFTLLTAPPGMTVDPGTGVVEWTPDDTGIVDVTVEASNSAGSDTQDFTIDTRSCPSTLVLNAGWNHVSVNVAPAPADILSILSGIVDEVSIVKQCDGKFCIPGSACDLDQWDALSAYDIHMKNAGSVPLCGSPVPCDSTIDLVPGWNCVSYLPTTSQAAEVALQSIATCLNICKAPDGKFYIPDQANSMGDMVVGSGYKMHLSCEASLTYPCDGGPLQAPSISVIRPEPRHFILEGRTGDYHAIVVSVSGDIEEGDEIGLYTNSGLLAGSAVCVDAVVPIAAWADDPMTPEKDGFAQGEKITWRVWRSAYNFETIVVPGLIDGTAAFGQSPYTTVEIEFSSSGVLPLAYLLHDNYPNPFNSNTVLRFSLAVPTVAQLTIFNIVGQHVRSLVDNELTAGEHEVEWDGSDDSGRPVATGVYLYRLTAGPYDQTRKMLLLK